MKKLLFLLLLITAGLQAQGISSPDFVTKHIITGKIELDGHEPKGIFIFEATLESVKIYDIDSKKEYNIRKCEEKDCKIIHLKENTFGSVKPYIINNTPFIQLAN